MGSPTMTVSPYLKTTMKIFFLTIVTVKLVSSQNCVFPNKAVTLKNGITSSTHPGFILESFKIPNLKSISPNSDSIVQILPCTANSSEILKEFVRIGVSVNNELEIKLIADPEQIQSQLIDQLKIYHCELEFSVACNDYRYKIIKLLVPLVDDNNKFPEFQQPQYDFNITLPWDVKVPINYNQPIIVTDTDRDLENALTECRIDSEFANRVEIRTKAILDSPYKHQFEILLYFTKEPNSEESIIWEPVHNVDSDLIREEELNAYNIENQSMKASTKLKFSYTKVDRELPRFAHLFYTIQVREKNENTFEFNDYAAVKAKDPDNLTEIRYEIVHTNLDKYKKSNVESYVRISPLTGDISIAFIPSKSYIQSLQNNIDVYKVTAKQLDNPNRNSTVPFLVYFVESNHPEPTETPTTEYPPEGTTDITKPVTLEPSTPFSTTSGFSESDEPISPTTPDSGFQCEKEGNFTDEMYCNKYIHCEWNIDTNSFMKATFCCEPNPDGTQLVFCEMDGRCITQKEADTDCRCIHDNKFDESCNPYFSCPKEDNFADEEYCNIFHTCQDIGNDEFNSFRRCCQPGTNGTYLTYCEGSDECLTEEETEKKCKREKKCRNDLFQCNNVFTCRNEGLYSDNYYCNVYHNCTAKEYNDYHYEDNKICCEFDPVAKRYKLFCETLGECIDADELEDKGCPCLIPGDPTSVDDTCGKPVSCTAPGEMFPDPVYCNIWYHCGAGSTPIKKCCPDGLVFCPSKGVCEYKNLESCPDYNTECQDTDCQDEISSFNFLLHNETFARQSFKF